MYNMWYIALGCIPVIIIGIVLMIVSKKMSVYSCCDIIGILTTFLSSVTMILFIAISICLPIIAKQEYEEFINTKEIVETLYDENNTLENAGLTSTVIELNNWLASAKASKVTWGNWSMYCYLDLDNLEYIQLET